MATEWVMTIVADAEVIPGPQSQIEWAKEYLTEKYGPMVGNAEEPE